MNKHLAFLSALALSAGMNLNAQNANNMVIQANKIGAEIQPTMYGHFFEDINYGADGGLYAELVKNRSFDFPQNFMGWDIFGKVTLQNDGPFERNPHYVRLSDPGHAHKRTGIENEGFFGIGIKANEKYRFTVWARGENQKIKVELINNASMGETQVITSQDVAINSKEWKKYEVILTPSETQEKAHLRIFLASPGSVDLEHVSLFPVDTWKGRENGLRKDLVQALADTKPGVFRFPGGCIVEGTDLATRYNWKNSVGPVENRPINENRWHYTFPHRFYPDYFQTYGMGFYELFLLAEDMGAEPLPVLNCGLSCQYHGDTNTKWGKLRADMGHPAPFNLKFIGIGNEQWGPEYPERLKLFVEAIRKAYPDMKIIGSSGPQSEGEDFDYLWPEMKKLKVDLVDEHFYRPESWFLKSGNRYDNYDRKGPKVFAGEYACHGDGKKWNHFHASLLEAAFLTGVERNADVVHMATYAPLLAHVEGWQWRPDMIWFDNLNSVKTASYYVQQMYATNMGTNVITAQLANPTPKGQDGLFTSAVFDKNTNEYIVKVINTTDKAQTVDIKLDGLKKISGQATTITLDCSDYTADNTLENPVAVVPVESYTKTEGNIIKANVGAKCFVIYKVKK